MVHESQKEVRVRFAPSPTGPLHLGSARTALFNWLFAKNQGGKFILRIEDTDLERSTPEYEQNIIESLKWLGLSWEEPFCRQSERLEIYEKYLKRLLDEDKAYYCFCSKEELEEERQAMMSQGLPPKYSGRCRHLAKEEVEKRLANGQPAVVRFKIPPAGFLEFNDLIRGKISFNLELLGDIVIARNLRSPLFLFASMIDDAEMEISHIIRGEDHISNTPKQILFFKALGFEEPIYAHLPLILSSDRSKLSKRYLETSVKDYKKQGYLPEAIVNFIALLGWHPQDNREIFSLNELAKEFNLKRVQKGGAAFSLEKLDWLNSQYLLKMNLEELANYLKEFVPSEWLINNEFFVKIVKLERERIKKLTDFPILAKFFFELPDYPAKLLIWGKTFQEDTLNNLQAILSLFKEYPRDYQRITVLAEKQGRGEIFWPLRVALSGQAASPGPFEIMEILGEKESLNRIEIAIQKIISEKG